MQNTYEVNGKLYSKEQLIALGKEKYPKLYWIPRIVGIILLLVSIFVCALLLIPIFVLSVTGVFDDPDFPKWVFAIPYGLFGGIGIGGVICIVASCLGRSKQTYIDHALAYLSKQEIRTINNEDGRVERVLTQDEIETLERNERLLKGRVITQEEYDRRKAEILNK